MIAESPSTSGEQLTRREQELVACILRGLTTTAALAEALTLSEHTVHYYVTIVFRKMGVTSRTQLVLYAMRYGTVIDDRWTPNP